MINELENPFSVTKATEFTDIEINEYWVNFNTKDDVSVETILNPNEFLPKYVIGGKGCGKTHILRYFSYPLQKIRAQGNINALLQNDKYIGLYSVFHGLNSSRFEGKGINQFEWESIFEYYFELYISDNALHTIQEIISLLNINKEIEKVLVGNILSIFRNKNEFNNINTIHDVINLLTDLRRKIDTQILNAAFTRKLVYDDIKVLFTPGDLIFGIPAVTSCIAEMTAVKFIYIFDEYEKLFEWQKVFINTLVWDKKNPVTFWIGARRYGYTSRATKSGEKMKQGSEFQEINLDVLIRSNEGIYKRFAEKLFQNRLIKYFESKGLKVSPEDLGKKFKEKFEKYDENNIINEVIQKNKKGEYKHIKDLRAKLSKGMKKNVALDIKDEKQIDNIVEAVKLYTNNNPLEQKYKTFFLCKAWYSADKTMTFLSILENMNSEYQKFIKNLTGSFKEIKDKRKKDFIVQLCKEYNIKNGEYLGIEKFIELSQGNARTFILTLKKTIEFAKIRGEKPLEDGGGITLDSQYLAVYDTARWFYEDAEVIGKGGKQMYDSLKNLTDYFMIHRFCDKPTETTVSCFYVKAEDLSENALEVIEVMKMHSIIIEDDDGRLEKNTGRKERLFQLNKILAPLWNLPIVERGTIYLNKEIAEAIFDIDFQKNFERFFEKRKSELNAPDFMKNSGPDPFTKLFD